MTFLIFLTSVFIPQSARNLDLGPRESSRDLRVTNGSILAIWTRSRHANPEALARSKFQVSGRLWYTYRASSSIGFPAERIEVNGVYPRFLRRARQVSAASSEIKEASLYRSFLY